MSKEVLFNNPGSLAAYAEEQIPHFFVADVPAAKPVLYVYDDKRGVYVACDKKQLVARIERLVSDAVKATSTADATTATTASGTPVSDASDTSDAVPNIAVKGSVIREAASLMLLPVDFIKSDSINSREYLINVRNGLLDMRSMELKPHTPSIFSTVQFPVASVASVASSASTASSPTPIFDHLMELLLPLETAPTLSAFIDDMAGIIDMTNIDDIAEIADMGSIGSPDDTIISEQRKQQKQLQNRKLLLSFIGACFSNVHGYEIRKAIYTYSGIEDGCISGFAAGQGNADEQDNAALTLFRRFVVNHLLGCENCLSISGANSTSRFHSVPNHLLEKRLISVSDIKRLSCDAVQLVRNLTGSDPVTVRFGYMDSYPCWYKGMLWLSGADLPKFTGEDSFLIESSEERFYDRVTPIKVDFLCEDDLLLRFEEFDIWSMKSLEERLIAEKDAVFMKAVEAFRKSQAFSRYLKDI